MTTSVSPYDGRERGEVADSTPDEVADAVRRAAAAAAQVALTDPAVRRDWLDAVATTLEQHSDELVALADEETALGETRLTGEVARTAGQLRFYADVAREGSYLGVAIDRPTPTAPRLVRVNEPLGPVAVFGASNFPFAFSVLGNDTASALAAGCPVVVKAHPAHVRLSHRLAELATKALAEAGAPEGTFALVSGHQAGVDLVTAEEIAAVAFTGSQQGGLALWRLANERAHVVPVFAEMGTVNPVVVTPAAASRLPEAAAGFVGSFTLGHGQFCTKPGLLLAPAGHDAARLVADALTAAAPAPVMLTAPIAKAVAVGVEDLVHAGATVVGEVPAGTEGFAAPAVVLAARADALVPGSRLLEECFGAVALVVEYDGTDELRRVLDVLQGSLAGTLIAASEHPAEDPDAPWLVRTLAGQVGRVTVGDWPTGVAYTWAQQHGGPWPATSAPAATSVGAAALDRFVRPVAYQSVPDAWVPPAGQDANPWGVPRRVDGVRS